MKAWLIVLESLLWIVGFLIAVLIGSGIFVLVYNGLVAILGAWAGITFVLLTFTGLVLGVLWKTVKEHLDDKAKAGR